MSQIRVDHLNFTYDGSPDPVFEDASFTLDTDWKIGLIGRNGKGKTTFLRLLTGELSGQGILTKSVHTAYFPYEVTVARQQQPASEFAEELRSGCELWRVICELSELEEDAEILYRPFRTLSPGQRTKVLLAVLFSGENDFLLIDEPTNHLDAQARECVKQYLSGKKGFILVSHDRDLLDACTDHILVLNRKTIMVQSGNFSCWQENQQRRDQFAKAENEKHLKEIRHLKQAARRTAEWADKSERTKIGFDPVRENDRSISTRAYIGAKTKKMQSRVKNTERRIEREISEKEGLLQDIEETTSLKLIALKHPKEMLATLRDFSMQYEGSAAPMCRDLNFTIRQGDRIALHGSNGCGKSTLMRLLLQLTGTVPPDLKTFHPTSHASPENITGTFRILRAADRINTQNAGISVSRNNTRQSPDAICHDGKNNDPLPTLFIGGTCETASGLVISYVPQDTAFLHGSIPDFCQVHGLDRSLFCTLLNQLDFSRTQYTKDISKFSAGQKKKVLLAASLLTPAHLYIWDEPLNFIDIFSRMQIENLINTYQPTMLFAEHDIRFRENIATGTVFF